MTLGQYSAQDALNRCMPIAKRVKLGDILNTLINAVNALAAQADFGGAVDAGAAAYGTGTLTVGGAIANGNWFTVTLVNASMPPLVTPGLVIGPIPIVTADTTTTVATKLAAALNANLTLINLGFMATSSGAVVTVDALGLAGNDTVMTAQLSAGAAITVAAVNPANGTGAVSPRNAALFAITQLSAIP
jgi:hypothetical protein